MGASDYENLHNFTSRCRDATPSSISIVSKAIDVAAAGFLGSAVTVTRSSVGAARPVGHPIAW